MSHSLGQVARLHAPASTTVADRALTSYSSFVNLTADEYRWAALARIRAAEQLHEAAIYASAIYLAGVAVECILRAYRVRKDPEFDSRHDLRELLSASGLQDYVPEKRRAQVAAALGDVWARWRNDYRYASDDRVLRDLRDRGLTLGIKGDPLRDNSRRVFEKAHELVGMGVARWKNA
jgi:HEPN domain-containing protein